MTTNWRYSGLLGLLVLVTRLYSSSLAAQQDRLDLKAIGQIADVLIDSLLPPNTLLSRVTVANRGIFFSHAATVSAFGHDTSGIPLSALQMRNPVRSTPKDILADCGGTNDPARATTRFRPCQRLGWGISFAFQPLSVTPSEVVVRAWLNWPDRGPEKYVEGVAPGDKAVLTGFATDVAFSRSPQGTLIYREQLRTMVF